jgi:hypothetical protein
MNLRWRIEQEKLEKLAQFAPGVFLTSPETRTAFRALVKRLTRTTPTLAEEYRKPMHRIWYEVMKKVPSPADLLDAANRAALYRAFSEAGRAPKILMQAFGIPSEEAIGLALRVEPEILAERLRQSILRTFTRRYPWLG